MRWVFGLASTGGGRPTFSLLLSLAEEDWHAVLDLPLIQLPMRKYSGLCFLQLFSSEVPYEDSAQFCNLV